jgi:hypothetical protein
MIDFTDVKLEIFIPQGHVDKVRDALVEAGVGVSGITIIASPSHRCRDHSARWKGPIHSMEK